MTRIYLSQLESVEDILSLTHRFGLGFETYEFGCGDALDQYESHIGEFVARYQACGQYGLSFHGPFVDLAPGSYDSLIRKATGNRFQRCYEVAKRLGAQTIVFHTGYNPAIYCAKNWTENSIGFWRDFLSDKDDAIPICIENHHDSDPRPILELLEAVNHPGFRACLDIGHANIWSGLPLVEWIDVLAPYTRHFHLNNNDGRRDLHWGFERGTIAIAPVLEQILRLAPKASWVLEMCDAEAVVRSIEIIQEVVSDPIFIDSAVRRA